MGNIMTDDPQKFLEAALGAVKKAEPIFCRYFGKARGVTLKPGKTPSLVSDADKEIETLLSKEISAHFPKHAIVGEEFPAVKKESEFTPHLPKGAGYTWYIDPIDGTTNYVHGFAHCCISVGLWDVKGPLVGVVSDPISGILYHAVRGGGAFKNGKCISVSARGALSDCLGTIGWKWGEPETGVDLLRRFAPRVYRLRVLSSSALDLCLVAEGALDFHASKHSAIWDNAASMVILTEAGGAVTDWKGEPPSPPSSTIAASNGKVHGELLGTLEG